MCWLFTECTRSGPPSWANGWGRVVFERCSDLRRAETPSELLLVTDLWDRSARNLLDDRKRRIKVA
jgi:hypothetical protein